MSGPPGNLSAIADTKVPGSESTTAASSDAAIFVAAAEIEKILSGLSNAKAKDALVMVAALRSLRVVSMDRPLGQIVQGNVKVPAIAGASAQKKSTAKIAPPQPAGWKKDKRWISIETERSLLLEKVKAAPPGDGQALTRLHDCEARMRTLKKSLQGGAIP